MPTVLTCSAATGPEIPALYWHIFLCVFPSKIIFQDIMSNAKPPTHYIYGTNTKCVKLYIVKGFLVQILTKKKKKTKPYPII